MVNNVCSNSSMLCTNINYVMNTVLVGSLTARITEIWTLAVASMGPYGAGAIIIAGLLLCSASKTFRLITMLALTALVVGIVHNMNKGVLVL